VVQTTFLAFVSGVLAVGSPCTLPILPGVVTCLGINRSRDDDSHRGWWGARTVVAGALFALGVAIALAATAALGVWLARGLALWRPPLSLIPATLLVVAGLATLEWQPLLRLRWRPMAAPGPGNGPALLTGLALGAGWAPCATPSLGLAMLAASHADSFGIGLAMLAGYVLGVVTPLCGAAVGLTRIRPVRSALRHGGRALQLVSGAALLVLAVLIGTGIWDRLSVQAVGWLASRR
jgi:cytochrome c-type biogenesis protein